MKISFKNLLSKGNRGALLVLLMAVVVTIAAMSISSMMAGNKLRKQANAAAENRAKTMQYVTTVMLMSYDWVSNSFIANIADVQIHKNPDSIEFTYTHHINRKLFENYSFGEIEDLLRNFMHYNSEMLSMTLIIEPGNYANVPERGIALTYNSEKDSVYDLLDTYDVFHSEAYAVGTSSSGILLCDQDIEQKDRSVLSLVIPLYDENGTLVGEFWLCESPDYLASVLQFFTSNGNEQVMLLDTNGRIISSIDKAENFKKLQDEDIKIGKDKVSDELFYDICSRVQARKVSKFSRNDSRMFIAPLKQTPFSLLVVEPESEIYETVSVVSARMLWISIGGLLLLAICLFYIFLSFKKKNESQQKMEHDLSLAANIQQGILPLNPTEEERQLNPNFDVCGYQKTAKMVGGDLYDYVVKDNKLHFCIGDVSGKGVPAALKMTELCSLYRYVIRTETDAAKIVASVNNAVMERDDDSVFCTMFVGVLDLQTGHLEFCNAGHNPPMLIRRCTQKVTLLNVKPNMPIYAFENYPYQKESLDLLEGDRLVCYTDGVTEAKNADNKFIGTEPVLRILSENADKEISQLQQQLLAGIENFTKNAEQHDDITMLLVEYKGRAAINTKSGGHLHYDTVGQRVVEIVEDVLSACGLPDDMRLRLALEELVQNVADYAYQEDGPLDVTVAKQDTETCLISLIDAGKPFNPLLVEAPDLSVGIEERTVGGLGIHFTRQIMNEVHYEYRNQHNYLHLKYKKQ